MTNTTPTQSSILKQHVRYVEISKVTKNIPLWLVITEEMLDRKSNNELKELGSGQTSISNMIERRCVTQFPTIYGCDCIDQSVTGKTSDRPTLFIPDNILDDVVDYINSMEIESLNWYTPTHTN